MCANTRLDLLREVVKRLDGDIHIVISEDTSILVNFYPWTVFSEKSRYIIFRGIMSGFISNCIGKKIEFMNFELTKRNYLTLILKK